MRIAVHDADMEHLNTKRRQKTFPNYALMKISAYHKSLGNTVEWWDKSKDYDLVYSSKVFSFTPENPDLPADTVKGGTGYGMFTELSEEIDVMFPDYSLYPDCDYAIGYITRGCPNHCRWCVVPRKEGAIKPYRTWQQLVRPDTDKLLLMDNNILACEYGINQLASLIGCGYRIDLNQGMDARLVTEEIAEILSKLKWIKYLRFSCDTTAQIEYIQKTAEMLGKRGIKPYRLFIYLLVTEDLDNAEYRVEQLKKLRGITIYAQAERKLDGESKPNFLAAMMYTQLFDTLYDTANFKYGGRLPVHVRCLLDEFANIGTIPDFDKLLATMRSMEISANIIIQNLAQLKKMYDKSWEIVTGNCDSLLFLGGKEDSTLEAISKSLGKETIDVVSQNRTRSHKSPSTSENNSILGRELMTPDELKVMKTNECVLIVRALYPFFCHKFDIEKHPNYRYLEDSNKKYAYLIDDLHTEKAPDMSANYTEKIPPKAASKPADDEKPITDVDIPEDTGGYEMANDSVENEFVGDENEVAAAIARHEAEETASAAQTVYNPNDRLDFSDTDLPNAEDLVPMDMSEHKIIGEQDYQAMLEF